MEAEPEALGNRHRGNVVDELRYRRVHHLGKLGAVEVVAERELDRLRGQDPLAVELTAAQQRAHEAQIVGAGPGETAPARPELRLGRQLERRRDEAAVRRARVEGRE